ncbi:uncharacterized protein LOC117643986 [Thrips palmi]|uniref:Uncharacterized protein LOC117643986 n=1 Tax=Thrips palmi TaxID=161013 RepID=A0A6P8ZLL5_THRPL|nr:uncharacterized protein LOC117643986 [Thrips palmi]
MTTGSRGPRFIYISVGRGVRASVLIVTPGAPQSPPVSLGEEAVRDAYLGPHGVWAISGLGAAAAMSQQLETDERASATPTPLPEPPVAVPIDPSLFKKRSNSRSPRGGLNPGSNPGSSPGCSRSSPTGSSSSRSPRGVPNPGSSTSPGCSRSSPTGSSSSQTPAAGPSQTSSQNHGCNQRHGCWQNPGCTRPDCSHSGCDHPGCSHWGCSNPGCCRNAGSIAPGQDNSGSGGPCCGHALCCSRASQASSSHGLCSQEKGDQGHFAAAAAATSIGTCPDVDVDLSTFFIKEEPADVDPADVDPAEAGAFGGLPVLSIASVAGNADDQWGLQTTLDFEAEVKTEPIEQYYDFCESEEEQDFDAEAEYSSVEPAASRVSPEVEVLPVPAREFEVVDLEAEWEDRESPPGSPLGDKQPPPRVVVKEEAAGAAREADFSPAAARPAQPAQPGAEGVISRVKGERDRAGRSERSVKLERDHDEEAGRALLFGQQEFPDDGEEELVADEERQADSEQQERTSGRSTALYPAVSSKKLLEMKLHVATIVNVYNEMKKPRFRTFSEERASSTSPVTVTHKSRARRPHSPAGPADKRRSSHDASSKKAKRDPSASPCRRSRPSSTDTARAKKASGRDPSPSSKDAKHPKKKALAPAPASVKKRRLQGVNEEVADEPLSPPAPASVKKRRLQGVKEEPVDEPLSPPAPPAPASVKKRRLQGVKEELADEPLSPPPPAPKSKKAFAGPASVKNKKKLPVLPAAQHPTVLSPQYDGRSPLFMEDDTPRKSYSSGPAESSEKGPIRASVRPSWLESLLYSIGKWRPEWLKEARHISSKKVPPLLPNMERFDVETKHLQFDSIDEYLSHFQNALLIELWETIRKESRPSKPFLTAVESSQDKPLLGNKRKRTLTCHCGSDQKSPFRLGDLVIVGPIGKSSEPAKPHFGYIEVASRNQVVSDSVRLSVHLQEHFKKEPDFKFSFKVTLCSDDNPETVPKVLALKKLTNVYEEVELFKFLSDFAIHNMAPLVLKPYYAIRPEPVFGLKTGGDLHPLAQKPVLLSLIQDIVDYEAPSLSVVEGGPGTGKTHLVAALAQELVERKHKLNRDCYVIIAAKSNNQLDIILEKLQARNPMLSDDPKNRDPDAFRPVWLGNELRVGDRLRRNSLRQLAEKHLLKQNTEPLEKDRRALMKEIARNETKLIKMTKKNFNFPDIASATAKMKLELTLLNERIEMISSQAKDENVAFSTILKKCDILLTTFSCNFYRSKAQEAILQSNQRKHKVLIIDDASEVGEPTVIKLMVLFGITDVVLFGDTRQHTPYVSSKWARNAGLVVPLMKRYTNALKEAQCVPPARFLSRQFRMHPDVLRGINKTFYEESMKPSNDYKRYLAEVQEHQLRPYVWFNCTYFDEKKKKKNEADFVIKLLSSILSCKSYPSDSVKKPISVISFSKDINALLACTEYAKYCDVAEHISSMEYDIVILSFGPSMRLRVDRTICALTRARKSLFICGNIEDLSPKFLALFKDARDLNCTEDVTTGDIEVEDICKLIRI